NSAREPSQAGQESIRTPKGTRPEGREAPRRAKGGQARGEETLPHAGRRERRRGRGFSAWGLGAARVGAARVGAARVGAAGRWGAFALEVARWGSEARGGALRGGAT